MANTAALGLIPSLLGLAVDIGTAIPGLKKPKRTDTSAKAARDASRKSAAAAVGGSQTGFGATRGLALRTGLRQASSASRAGAAEAAQAANADEIRFNQQLIARNQRVADFGQRLGSAGATIGQGVVEAQAAKSAEEEAAAVRGGAQAEAVAPLVTPEARGIDPATGLEQQEAPTEIAGQEGELTEQEVIDQTLADANVGPTKAFSEGFDPTRAALGLPQITELQQIAPELEFKLRMQNMALQEAERQGQPIERVFAQLNRQLGNIPNLQQPGELDAGFDEDL